MVQQHLVPLNLSVRLTLGFGLGTRGCVPPMLGLSSGRGQTLQANCKFRIERRGAV
jgi:hypothetical protein